MEDLSQLVKAVRNYRFNKLFNAYHISIPKDMKTLLLVKLSYKARVYSIKLIDYNSHLYWELYLYPGEIINCILPATMYNFDLLLERVVEIGF